MLVDCCKSTNAVAYAPQRTKSLNVVITRAVGSNVEVVVALLTMCCWVLDLQWQRRKGGKHLFKQQANKGYPQNNLQRPQLLTWSLACTFRGAMRASLRYLLLLFSSHSTSTDCINHTTTIIPSFRSQISPPPPPRPF